MGFLTSDDWFASQESGLSQEDLNAWNGEQFSSTAGDANAYLSYLPDDTLSELSVMPYDDQGFNPSPLFDKEALSATIPDTGASAWATVTDKAALTALGSSEEEPWYAAISTFWKNLGPTGQGMLANAILGAGAAILKSMDIDKTYDRQDQQITRQYEREDKLSAEARARRQSATPARRLAYQPVSLNYSAPGLLNVNRGTV